MGKLLSSCISMMVSPYNKRKVAVASEMPFFTLGFDQTTCSLHKVCRINHTISSHNSALLSRKHLKWQADGNNMNQGTVGSPLVLMSTFQVRLQAEVLWQEVSFVT